MPLTRYFKDSTLTLHDSFFIIIEIALIDLHNVHIPVIEHLFLLPIL